MNSRISGSRVLWALVWMTAALAAPATAQVATGRIDATVTDSTGAVLAGVSMDISGPQHATAVTDALGQAHFLNLAPGTYAVGAKQAGFGDYLNRSVPVTTGQSVDLAISLWVAGVSTQVQVASQAPIVDVRKTTTTTNVTLEQLQDVPNARDPWVILQTVPGIIVDRVNVGGSESGQQSNYTAKGAAGSDNTWNIDGIAVTDMAAAGATPLYYDFDQIKEMSVTTGGADVKSGTPGVQLNVVLKSGTDVPHGSTRIYFENEGLESNNMPSGLAAIIGGASGKGNRTHLYDDYGVEFGGPILKDRVWGWGAAGKTHIDIVTLTGIHDITDLQDDSLKIEGNIRPDIRGSFTYFRGDKHEDGRGASPARTQETTWDQSGPSTIYKGEADFVLSSQLFLVARAAHVSGGFSLTPEGGVNASWYIDDSGVAHGSETLLVTNRPQNTVSLDGNSFHGHHELKFGLAWRKSDVQSTDTYPGNGIVTVWNGYPEMIAEIFRNYAIAGHAQYVDAYAGDTWSRDRLTVNAGVRWDRQAGSLDAGSVPASAVAPSLLPALSAAPVGDAIVWNAIAPRIGVTYALDAAHTTTMRATYAVFASQMGSLAASVISPIQSSGIEFPVVDTNGNKVADPSELGTLGSAAGNIGFFGFDPNNPSQTTTNNVIGSYKTPLSQEIAAGIDHELMPNFAVSGTFTYRYYYNYDWNALRGVSQSDYTQTGTCAPAAPGPCGSANDVGFLGNYSVPYYALNANAVPAGGGTSYELHQGYHTRYLGLELSATKRMSHRWMARFGFSTNSDREYFTGPNSLQDPTPTPVSPHLNGGLVVTETAGSGKSNIFLVLPRYQFVANGLWQGPRGVNLGFNYLLRQGFAEPYYRSNVPTLDPLGSDKAVLLVSDVAQFRLPASSQVDGRIEKVFTVWKGTLAIDLDAFNLLNVNTVLGKQYDVRLTGSTGLNQTLEIMEPRILRLGARFSF